MSANMRSAQVKLAALAAARRNAQLRKEYGESLCGQVAASVGITLVLSDFDQDWRAAQPLEWPTRLEQAPGLVAAYVGWDTALRLLRCMQERLPSTAGRIGFHDKDYLGFAPVRDIALTSLLTAASVMSESVLLYIDNPGGVVLVDYSPASGPGPYSLVVQGLSLIETAKHCFVRPFSGLVSLPSKN